MKLLNRWVLGGLTLALALSLCAGPADAASKKKKKKEVVKKEEHHARHEMMGGQPMPIAGLNLSGKPGYFFADTASVLNQGQIAGAAHVSFDSWGSAFQIPVGVSYGITDKITVNVNTAFYSAGGFSGLNYLGFGAKYGFMDVGHNKNLDIAAGVDFAVGALYTNIYGTDFAFDPYGVVTYTFADGFQLNGKLGLYIQTYNYSFDGFNLSGSWSYFQFDLGAAYPFDKDLTGIAELATNGVVAAGGVGGTPLIVGIRTGHDVQLQAFGGLDLGGTVGLIVGGGVVLLSE
jgi:hypothetical protein